MIDDELDIKLINLDSTSPIKINKILSEYFMEGEIDEDGDILIKGNSRIYIRVDEEESAIRIFSFIHLSENIDRERVTKRVDLRNRASSTVKYTMMKNSVMVEYAILTFGHIDHKHLIKTIQHIEGEIALLKMILSEYEEGLSDGKS